MPSLIPRSEFNLFQGVTRVVDLCAAPGSWSQVLSRVLIKGEKFGRASWEDRDGKLRQQLRKLYGVSNDTEAPQLCAQETRGPRENVKIVAIDLQPMSPLEGITTLRADITHPATVPLLLRALDPEHASGWETKHAANPVDLVLSDGAPDVTGLHDLDIYLQSQLLYAALNLALCVLRPGGRFIAKIFRGRNVDLLYAQLKIFFEDVVVAKPRSSRASSIEAFIVCSNFHPPEGYKASLDSPLGTGDELEKILEQIEADKAEMKPRSWQDPETSAWTTVVQRPVMMETKDMNHKIASHRWIAPFLACGDLSAFDADASYHLPKDHVTLDPVQPPTAPPYKTALELRRAAGGAYGKTNLR